MKLWMETVKFAWLERKSKGYFILFMAIFIGWLPALLAHDEKEDKK